ncbi:MAG: Verru_Chthon cassette protein A, partial [Verrucomicrobiota bacterium]
MNRIGQSGRKSGSKKGVALIAVLMLFALATLVVLTFVDFSVGEMRSASAYADGIHAETLANSAVNLAIAQIRSATTGRNRLWTSQPGAIRTYNRDGEFEEGYKLYSDDLMWIPGDENRFAFEDADELRQGNWSERPEQWTDLNEALIRGPRAYFPIADPAAAREMKVEGFSFDASLVGEGPMDEALRRVGSQSIPMPVRWLYQLADGTVGVLDDEGEFVVTRIDRKGRVQVKRGLATEKNPIVGRFAFWSDDETTKVNINTASEPTFWDTPRAASRAPKGKGGNRREFDDRSFGWSQPANREYSRFPGHPAQTALSPVLFAGLELPKETKKILIEAAPKQGWGGSKSGTIPYQETSDAPVSSSHLYPSVDEYLFDQFRRPREIQQDTGSAISSEELIEYSRFFLTASSRAPELNLFDEPRISIWPTHADEETEKGKHRSTFDDLIRFCSSLEVEDERLAYSFQRRDSDSLKSDWDSIPRNEEIFEYLLDRTGTDLPGFGGNFRDKFGDDHPQVLTEIFDYIRSSNLYDENLKPVAYGESAWSEEGKGSQFTDGRRGARSRISFPGHGQVTPIEIDPHGTRGFGRFLTISEVGFILICCGDAGGPDPNDKEKPEFPEGILGSNVPGVGKGKNRMLPRTLD